MNPDNDFDTLLTGLDHDEIPNAGAFVDAVMVRVDQHHRYRRIMLAVVGSLITLGACVAMMLLPISVAPGSPGSPFQVFTLFALASMCGLAWVATEDTSLPSSADKIG